MAETLAELLARMARLETEIKRMQQRLERLEAARDRRQGDGPSYEISAMIG